MYRDIYINFGKPHSGFVSYSCSFCLLILAAVFGSHIKIEKFCLIFFVGCMVFHCLGYTIVYSVLFNHPSGCLQLKTIQTLLSWAYLLWHWHVSGVIDWKFMCIIDMLSADFAKIFFPPYTYTNNVLMSLLSISRLLNLKIL